MNILSRKAAPEPEITGTMALQRTLKVWLSRPGASPGNIARDVNEALANAVDRSTANDIAKKMVGDASEDVVRGIAKQLMPGLSGTTKPTAQVSEGQLRDFAASTVDLPAEVKQQLAIYMFSGHSIYDPESDMMDNAHSAAPTLVAPCVPEQWQHPDENVRKTHAAYLAALQAYNGPPPARPRPSPHTEFGRTKTAARVEIVTGRSRRGFAGVSRNVAPRSGPEVRPGRGAHYSASAGHSASSSLIACS